MAVTLSWTNTKTQSIDDDTTEYYKVGIWYVDGVEKGVVETRTDSSFVQITSDADIIAQLEESLEH